MRTPLVEKQIPEQSRRLGISEEDVVKKVMLKDTVDGQFTTLDDVADVALLFASFPDECAHRPVAGRQPWMVHAIARSRRLPGYVISAEVIFGMPDQKLSIRHDSGSSARPYVDGALLAIRKVSTLVGLHRGLDSVLDL